MKKSICLICILLFFSLNLSGCFENKQNENKPDEKTQDEIGVIDTDGLDNIVLDKDLVEISALNNLVKIDSISSGLDTYAFDTILFDLENRVVSGFFSRGCVVKRFDREWFLCY